MAETARLTEGQPNSSSVQKEVDEVEDLFQTQSGHRPVALEVPSYPPDPPKPGSSVPLLPPGEVSSTAPQDPAYAYDPPSSPHSLYNTLNEPVAVTLKRDLYRIVVNLWQVVFPKPVRDSASRPVPLKDWDLWGPFFFIISLALILSATASEHKSEVFAVVFGVLSIGAIVLTLNVLLLGGHIIFFQSLSVLGYCLFPIDVGAVVCLFVGNKLIRFVVVVVTLAWSSWAAYPFVSGAVSESRRALAVYPVFLLYISVGFLVLAND